MKLLQLNSWQMRLAKNIIDLMRDESPDIVCLQEVFQTEGELGYITSLKSLQEKTHYPHQYYSPFYSFVSMDEEVEFGNAILSRPTISSRNTIFTSGVYKNNFTFSHDDYNVRNMQHVIVDCHGTAINVLNHHGFHVPKHKDGDSHTLAACQQIADYIEGLQGPVILTGDFNLLPDSESLNILNKRLRNLSIEHDLQTTRNDLTVKDEVCDYIFVNDMIKVHDFYVSDKIVSDHQGLLLDFSV